MVMGVLRLRSLIRMMNICMIWLIVYVTGVLIGLCGGRDRCHREWSSSSGGGGRLILLLLLMLLWLSSDDIGNVLRDLCGRRKDIGEVGVICGEMGRDV